MNANLAVMGKVMLNDMQSISGGIMGGAMQRKLDINSLTWPDQYNPDIVMMLLYRVGRVLQQREAFVARCRSRDGTMELW